MPKIYVKDAGTWKETKLLWIKQGGVWVNPKSVLVYSNGIGQQVYPDIVGPTTYAAPGSYTYTVPTGITSIQVAATGAGASGSVIFFNAGAYGSSPGNAGGNTTVTNGTWTLTARGGPGSNSVGGTVTISGASATVLNQQGGTSSGGTGGSSYYGSGTTQVGDFQCSAVPSAYGAGSGGGFPDGSSTFGGAGGGTGIANFAVTPGQTINITVGAGGAGQSIPYSRGGNHLSCAGAGAGGFVIITPLNTNTAVYTTNNTFTVPTGITRLRITAVGGGGGGGGSLLAGCGSVNHSGGSGGGGGGIFYGYANVTPGQVISFNVGSGGSPGAAYDNRFSFGGNGAVSGQNGGNTTVTGTNISITAGGGRNGSAPGTDGSPGSSVGSNCGFGALSGGAGGSVSFSGSAVSNISSQNGGAGGAGGDNGASGGTGSATTYASGGTGGGGSGSGEPGAGGGGGGASYGAGGVGGRFQTGLSGSGNGANYGAGGGGMGGAGGGYGGMGTGFGAGGVVIIEYGTNI